MGEIKKLFPHQNKAKFDFRFRLETKNEAFWVDLEDGESAPFQKNCVSLKLNRLTEYKKGV